MKNFFACFLFLPVCCGTACAAFVCHPHGCVSAEVVSKPEDMQRGLMGREHLEAGHGMFFVFADDGEHRFWMKNMRFALDIVWISRGQTIVDIGQQLPVCGQGPCPVYAPGHEARYVLEVEAGYTKAHGWKSGDTLQLKNIESH